MIVTYILANWIQYNPNLVYRALLKSYFRNPLYGFVGKYFGQVEDVRQLLFMN